MQITIDPYPQNGLANRCGKEKSQSKKITITELKHHSKENRYTNFNFWVLRFSRRYYKIISTQREELIWTRPLAQSACTPHADAREKVHDTGSISGPEY